MNKAKQSTDKYQIAKQEEENITNQYIDLLYGRETEIKESNLINAINVETTKISDDSTNLKATVTAEDESKIIGYHFFVVKKSEKTDARGQVSSSKIVEFTNLTPNTEYEIYTVAYDIYNKNRISSVKTIKTLNEKVTDYSVLKPYEENTGEYVNANMSNNSTIKSADSKYSPSSCSSNYQYPGLETYRAFDGYNYNRYNSGNTIGGEWPYIQYAIPTYAKLKKIELYNYSADSTAIQKFKIQQSCDGKEWKDITDTLIAKYNGSLQKFDINATKKGKYFRLQVLSNYGYGGHNCSVCEIKLIFI